MKAIVVLSFFVIFTILPPSFAIADMHDLASALYPKDGPNGLLWVACNKGDGSLIKEALDGGASINSLSSLGYTCLMFLAGHTENEDISSLALYLIRHGGDVNIRGPGGQTPLFYAADSGNFSLVELFLSEGADPNLSETDGQSPLIRAARRGYFRIAKILVRKGANISHKDIYGDDAIKNALEKKHFKMAEYLKKMSGK